MEKIVQEIETAFRLLSGIAVAGDAVDTMAAVRNKLRKAHAALTAEIETHKEKVEDNA